MSEALHGCKVKNQMKISWRTSLGLIGLALSVCALADDDLLGEKRGSGSGSSGGVSSGGGGGNNNSGGNRGGGNSGSNRGNSNSRSEERVISSGRSNSDATIVRSGRSGRVDYRSNNNMSSNRSNSNAPVRVESFSSSSRSNSRGGEIARQARTEEEVRRAYSRGSSFDYRYGYYSYTTNWRDNDFWYPYYGFQWDSRNCVISPFYGYSNLPPYIRTARVQFGNFWIDINEFTSITFRDNYRYDRRYEYYDEWEAVNDLTRVFTRKDYRALGDLVPPREMVRVRGDWAGDYTINSDDFYDMMRDAISSTQTRVFAITDIERGRGFYYSRNSRYNDRNNGRYDDRYDDRYNDRYDNRYNGWDRSEGDYMRIVVDHQFTDAWRRNQRIYMEFILERQRRGNYIIAEFGTYEHCP